MEKNIQLSDFIAIFMKEIKSQGRISVPKEYVGHKCCIIIDKKEGSK